MPDVFDGGGLWPTAGTEQSIIAWLDKGNVSGATLRATENIVPGDLVSYELGIVSNGATTWETVQNGTLHWFTAAGSGLMWRVTMVGIGGTATRISDLRVEVVTT